MSLSASLALLSASIPIKLRCGNEKSTFVGSVRYHASMMNNAGTRSTTFTACSIDFLDTFPAISLSRYSTILASIHLTLFCHHPCTKTQLRHLLVFLNARDFCGFPNIVPQLFRWHSQSMWKVNGVRSGYCQWYVFRVNNYVRSVQCLTINIWQQTINARAVLKSNVLGSTHCTSISRETVTSIFLSSITSQIK